MAYNTGNPIGSVDARDLYDNAQNMDKAVNQTTARWSDRFGVSRPSWSGMSHYNNVGEYAAGILITGYNEVFRYDGEFYRAAAATTLPYTTTGSWSEDGPLFVPVGDAVLRHDIAYEADMYIGYYRNAINCNQYGGLEAAVADSDTLGKTIIVTDTQDVSIPLDFTDRDLFVEYGGLITFSGTGAVTGLKYARAEWFDPDDTVYADQEYYRDGDSVFGVTQDLPLAKSSVTYNSYDNPPINNDRNFNVVSQMWSGVTPTASPTDNPSNATVAGSFTVHAGGNSATAIMALNAMISTDARPTGTVNTSGTAVTRTAGTAFLTGSGWVNSPIIVGTAAYEIASVTDADHLVLKSSAGVQTGVAYKVGSAIGVELDVNVNGADEGSSDAIGTTGLIVASGGTKHPSNGIAINNAFTPNNAWRRALLISGYTDQGIYVLPPDASFPFASGVDIQNGTLGASYFRGGTNAIVLTGIAQNLLRITPSADEPTNAVIYCSNAANDAINWRINQDGSADLYPQNVFSVLGDAYVKPFTVVGRSTLVAGTVTIDLAKAFTDLNSYFCTATDITAPNAIQVVNVSGSQITFNGTGTDEFFYICIGN